MYCVHYTSLWKDCSTRTWSIKVVKQTLLSRWLFIHSIYLFIYLSFLFSFSPRSTRFTTVMIISPSVLCRCFPTSSPFWLLVLLFFDFWFYFIFCSPTCVRIWLKSISSVMSQSTSLVQEIWIGLKGLVTIMLMSAPCLTALNCNNFSWCSCQESKGLRHSFDAFSSSFYLLWLFWSLLLGCIKIGRNTCYNSNKMIKFTLLSNHDVRRKVLSLKLFQWFICRDNCTTGPWGWPKLKITPCGKKSSWRVHVVNYNRITSWTRFSSTKLQDSVSLPRHT
jgi:hypothetical protein